MFSVLWALLLPVVLGGSTKVDITTNTPGITWSPGWVYETGAQYLGGTLMSVRSAGATLTYKFTGKLHIEMNRLRELGSTDVVTFF